MHRVFWSIDEQESEALFRNSTSEFPLLSLIHEWALYNAPLLLYKAYHVVGYTLNVCEMQESYIALVTERQ